MSGIPEKDPEALLSKFMTNLNVSGDQFTAVLGVNPGILRRADLDHERVCNGMDCQTWINEVCKYRIVSDKRRKLAAEHKIKMLSDIGRFGKSSAYCQQYSESEGRIVDMCHYDVMS